MYLVISVLRRSVSHMTALQSADMSPTVYYTDLMFRGREKSLLFKVRAEVQSCHFLQKSSSGFNRLQEG